MVEFLKVATPLMAIVSMCLVLAGLVPSLRRSKAFNFLCGESSFVTAMAYGSLAGSAESVSFYNLMAVLWFIASSVKFAHSAWLTS